MLKAVPEVAAAGAETVKWVAVPGFTVSDAVEVRPGPVSVADTVPVVLVLVPKDCACTLTLNVHDALAARVAPERDTDEEPATAVIVPPPHDPVRPLGDATTRPDGRESLKATPVSEMVVLGLVRVKLRALELPAAMVAGVNDWAMVGGASAFTVRVAVAAVPAADWLVVTVEVVFTFDPVVVPLTLRMMVQDEPAASVLDVTVTDVGAERVTVPPPVPASVAHVPPVCATSEAPDGMVSLNATFVSAVALGLVTVMVSVDVPPT